MSGDARSNQASARQPKIMTVCVAHDRIEAMTIADRAVIMDGGSIQQLGTPENAFAAGFIGLGLPPMNLIEGRVST